VQLCGSPGPPLIALAILSTACVDSPATRATAAVAALDAIGGYGGLQWGAPLPPRRGAIGPDGCTVLLNPGPFWGTAPSTAKLCFCAAEFGSFSLVVTPQEIREKIVPKVIWDRSKVVGDSQTELTWTGNRNRMFVDRASGVVRVTNVQKCPTP